MKPIEAIDVIIRGGVMSLDELQNETGITLDMLLEWLHGRGEPDEEQKRDICRALGSTPRLFTLLETASVPSDLPPRHWDHLAESHS